MTVAPERLCADCGLPWPKLTEHRCPEPTREDPECLVAFLADAMSECEVPLGNIDISPQIISVLARPLARRLWLRVDEMLAAIDDDVRGTR